MQHPYIPHSSCISFKSPHYSSSSPHSPNPCRIPPPSNLDRFLSLFSTSFSPTNSLIPFPFALTTLPPFPALFPSLSRNASASPANSTLLSRTPGSSALSASQSSHL